MNRIDKLSTYLEKCKTFADIGCDHGYLTERMLKNNLCEFALITDISSPSLAKAEKRLKKYIDAGICRSECCFGLEKVPNEIDFVVIAGMGGEEILSILKEGFLPKKFLFQPMKNAEKLRRFLLDNNAHIERDELFYCGEKYYFVIKGDFVGEKSVYSDANLKFGLDLTGEDIRRYLTELKEKREDCLLGRKDSSIESEIELIKGVLSGEIN